MTKQDKATVDAIKQILDQVMAENRGAIWGIMRIVEITGWKPPSKRWEKK